MKLTTLKALVLAAGMSCSAGALAAATLIQDVRVFDGNAVHERRSVLIDHGVIVNADYRGAAPAGARIVSGAGRTLLPGLIDSHVHAFRDQELPLLFGVTTQVDMFTGVQIMQDTTRAMAAGHNSHQADMFSAGTMVTAKGGHGTQFGVPIPTLADAAGAQAFVDARIAEGSQFIKIALEEGHGAHRMNSLDIATVKAAIEAAHRRGKLAVVHISTLANAQAALEAGADGLVHLFIGTAIAPRDAEAQGGLVHALTTFARSGYLRRAKGAGVRGYLLKDAPADTLAAAIRTVHGGGRAVAPELALESWSGGQDPLPERERQVLRLAGEGKSSADIARLVHLSEGTVRNYLSEAISKLDAGNRVEAYRLARDALFKRARA
jgi:DNA-binding CsgD family transcriptional regulator/imidazolonepropionase-like amidohydrolase